MIVYNYPEGTKPFNVRLNDDGKTVAAFDVVLPKVSTWACILTLGGIYFWLDHPVLNEKLFLKLAPNCL